MCLAVSCAKKQPATTDSVKTEATADADSSTQDVAKQTATEQPATDQPAATASDEAVLNGGFLNDEDYKEIYYRCLLPNDEDLKTEFIVIGHKSPDTDTVGSAIACAELLKLLGYNAKPMIAGKINNETKYVLNECDIEVPELLENAAGKDLILVDHNGTANAVDGLKQANIHAIIDHHNIASLTDKPIYFDNRPVGACATAIASLYQKFGITPDAKTCKLLALTILSDTVNFTNQDATFADKRVFEKLSALGGILSVEDSWAAMSAAKNSYDGMTDEEIFYSDIKNYETENYRFCIAYVHASGEEELKDYSDRMYKVMEENYDPDKYYFMSAQISDRPADVCYLRTYGANADEICKKALAEIATFDGTNFIMIPGVSRKTVISPLIIKELN